MDWVDEIEKRWKAGQPGSWDVAHLIAEVRRLRAVEGERDAAVATVRRMEDDLYTLPFGLGSIIELLTGMRDALSERYSKCGPDYSAVTRPAPHLTLLPTCPDCEAALAEHETPAEGDA